MSNRIDTTFARLRAGGQKAFVAYVSAGDPDMDRSLEIIKGLADIGSNIIELGVPFSDPLADGVVNQMAADRALKAGATTRGVLDLVRRFRESHETPIVLFTYLNPVYAYGFEDFHRDAGVAGVDGMLLLDLPPDEARCNAELVRGESLHPISLIAPTTPDGRVGLLAKESRGFVYAVSRTGVTGAHGAPSASIGAQVARIKQHTDTPVCVGFGINTPAQAAEVAADCDGVIVGSAIVKQVAENADRPDVAAKVAGFTKPLIEAVKMTNL
jgi:tryptophan synthase alpha chain